MPQAQKFHLAGVMGWPVMHSRSPLMHNYWFDQQRLVGAYVPLAIEPDGLAAALRAMKPLGFSGCNLTIPHKQEAMAIVDEIDEVARRIGAISCVVVQSDGALFGTNNDWIGFIRNLKTQVPEWRADSGPVAVIGAGGGARAICYGLMQEGAAEIRLVNRTRERAQAIADEFAGPLQVVQWSERHDALDGVATVVNTTSQGMVGQPPLDLQLDRLPLAALVADIVYTPLQSPFLAAARARGNATVNGLGMLLHQGPPAWKMWFGIEPTVSTELRERMEQSLT
jgi:shikimate dehydrogenase